MDFRVCSFASAIMRLARPSSPKSLPVNRVAPEGCLTSTDGLTEERVFIVDDSDGNDFDVLVWVLGRKVCWSVAIVAGFDHDLEGEMFVGSC